MIRYNRYINNQDHVWYDSSNVVYSRCYDNSEQTKTLKTVFKNGATYVYRNVDVNDYLAFKLAQSNGKAFNEHISKKYKETYVRLADTDLDALEQFRVTLETEEKEVDETQLSNLLYHIDCVESDGSFKLSLNNKTIFTGKEGEVSILNLFRAMGIKYTIATVDGFEIDNDENIESLSIN